MTFILSEDAALKALLTGITVSDAKNPSRPVGVWFGQPDLEIREQSYPYITIQLIDIAEDTSRAHRGIINLPYQPEGYTEKAREGVEFPIPVDIHYQVTTYSRHPYHDRALMAELLQNRLNVRFGGLHITEDNTLRRLDLLGYSKRDVAEQDKRLFVNVFSIRVSSEILVSKMEELIPVSHINTTYDYTVQQSITTQA